MTDISNGEKLLRLYLVSTVSLFSYTAYQKFNTSDNYFQAVLTYVDDSFT